MLIWLEPINDSFCIEVSKPVFQEYLILILLDEEFIDKNIVWWQCNLQ